MRLIKCGNGHVYDRDKLGNCPHCSGVIKRLEYEPDTFGRGQKECTTEVSVKEGKGSHEVVRCRQVGLLVTKSGKRPGQSYQLYEGTNRIGRAENLEVSLPEEDTISRGGHAEILYQNGSFYLFAVKEQRDVYVNGKRIHSETMLKDRDLITMGECDFVFVKFDDVYE